MAKKAWTARRVTVGAAEWVLAVLALASMGRAAHAAEPYAIAGDGIPQSLSGSPGDVERGRTIVATRQIGLCLLCHTAPVPEERFQGTLAPNLSGAGSRFSAAQLRLRLADSRKLNPASIMPSYFRTDGLTRVGVAWQGKTILSAQQIEDVIVYLQTLKTASN